MTKSPKKIKKVKSAKEERLFHNLLKIIEQYIKGKAFVPSTEDELMQRLSLPLQHLDTLKEVLASLCLNRVIKQTNDRYTLEKNVQDTMTGVIHMHNRGFGFVQPDDPILHPQDIFIPKHLTKNAVEGDLVEVQINNEIISEKGPEGKIIAILSRARTHMAGVVKMITINGDIFVHAPLLGSQQRVIVQPSKEKILQVGDRIVMEIIDWGTKETETVCRLTHYIGHITDPSCDIAAAIEEYELKADFPSKAIEEAHRYGNRVLNKDLVGRLDLRDIEIFTIDPETAKDFDDALNLSKDQSGYYHLGVHIADVSHYVKPGTALDDEAQTRAGTSYRTSLLEEHARRGTSRKSEGCCARDSKKCRGH